jgi:hypothetical protein
MLGSIRVPLATELMRSACVYLVLESISAGLLSRDESCGHVAYGDSVWERGRSRQENGQIQFRSLESEFGPLVERGGCSSVTDYRG